MTDIQIQAPWEKRRSELEREIGSLSTDELKVSLAKKLTLTAESFFEAALIMRELEEVRGVDMQPIAKNLTIILRKIAYGQMIPELMVYCGTNGQLLTRVASLPIPDQRRLVEGSGIEFAEGSDHRLVDPREAQSWQLKQMFASDHIRPLHEQRQWLSGRERPRPRRFKPIVTRLTDVLEDEMTASITVCITPEWDSAIRIMAKENGWPIKYAGTRFLISLGKTKA